VQKSNRKLTLLLAGLLAAEIVTVGGGGAFPFLRRPIVLPSVEDAKEEFDP
jgi:hypothetical protein